MAEWRVAIRNVPTVRYNFCEIMLQTSSDDYFVLWENERSVYMKPENHISTPFCILNSSEEKSCIFYITNTKLIDIFSDIYPLEYLYKISNTTDRHYKSITIKKRNGEPRYIKAPDT